MEGARGGRRSEERAEAECATRRGAHAEVESSSTLAAGRWPAIAECSARVGVCCHGCCSLLIGLCRWSQGRCGCGGPAERSPEAAHAARAARAPAQLTRHARDSSDTKCRSPWMEAHGALGAPGVGGGASESGAEHKVTSRVAHAKQSAGRGPRGQSRGGRREGECSGRGEMLRALAAGGDRGGVRSLCGSSLRDPAVGARATP